MGILSSRKRMSERGGDAQRALDAGTLGPDDENKPSELVVPVDATPPAKVVVFGSGSFGTALGTLIARNGYHGARAEEPSHAGIVRACDRPRLGASASPSPRNPRPGNALVVHVCGR